MMLSKDFYESLPDEERAAIDTLLSAIGRLAPFGYFVGLVTPEDAMWQAPHLSLDDARAFINAHQNQLADYLLGGEHARDLLDNMLRDHGH